jgi:hypothetical protein
MLKEINRGLVGDLDAIIAYAELPPRCSISNIELRGTSVVEIRNFVKFKNS